MKYRTLPGTALRVSEVCLGTMTWGEQNSEAEAHEQLDYAVARGINFIDTAEMYPAPPNAATQGRTETYLGNWLARRPRDGLVIASKVAGPGRRDWIRNGRTDLTREIIAEAVDTSLARLQIDCIDLYQRSSSRCRDAAPHDAAGGPARAGLLRSRWHLGAVIVGATERSRSLPRISRRAVRSRRRTPGRDPASRRAIRIPRLAISAIIIVRPCRRSGRAK